MSHAGAPINSYGIGTSLTTASDAPALDCAYKLQEYAGEPRRKRSEGKATWPGRKQVWRRYDEQRSYDRRRRFACRRSPAGKALLYPVMRGGRRLSGLPDLTASRRHAREQLTRLPEALAWLELFSYPVEISARLRGLAAELDRRTGYGRLIVARDSHDGSAPPDIAIGSKVEFLGSAGTYAERPSRVERIETHFSWVFLTDRYVYKLKKPLRNGGVDFSILEARRAATLSRKLRLNRRLARDVYIGVLPLTFGAGGLAIAGTGAVVDWLVKMRRLPAEKMLDFRLVRGDWCHADIQALAATLAGFFAGAQRVNVEPTVHLDRFRAECRSSRRAFQDLGGPALGHAAKKIVRRLEAFMFRHHKLLLRRTELGQVVEGHGDLRPEHVILGPSPLVIDCLEFRTDLRCLDPVDELAFLAWNAKGWALPVSGGSCSIAIAGALAIIRQPR